MSGPVHSPARTPAHTFVPVMDHELHVTHWGDPDAPALVMWHGLARTGRDFDELAAALSDSHFVLCPDTIGRGLSSWARQPEVEYSIEYLAGVAADMLDHFNVDRAGWLGTSMGGLIGMRMASGPLAKRLDWLIVNDIGPELPEAAIARIVGYVGELPAFATLTEAEAWLRTAYAPFGPASDAFWRRMARSSVRRRDDGSLTLHYDPQILTLFTHARADLASWDRFERITLPLHVIRGAESDLLTAPIAERMSRAGPRPGLTVIEQCGHAPTLSRAEDIALVRDLVARLAGG